MIYKSSGFFFALPSFLLICSTRPTVPPLLAVTCTRIVNCKHPKAMLCEVASQYGAIPTYATITLLGLLSQVDALAMRESRKPPPPNVFMRGRGRARFQRPSVFDTSGGSAPRYEPGVPDSTLA